jgi:signal transduction histidine kinase
MHRSIVLWLLLLFQFPYSIGQSNRRDSLKNQLAYAKEDTAKVNLLYNIASTYIEFFIGYNSKINTDSAIIYVQKAMLLASELGYPDGEARGLLTLAAYNRVTGNYSHSLIFLFKALDIYEKLKDEYAIANTHMSFLATYRDAAEYTNALIHAFVAKQILDRKPTDSQVNFKGSVLPMMPVLLEEIGNIYLHMNILDSAEFYTRKAIDEKLFINGSRWNFPYYLLGNIEVKQNKPNEALAYYKMAIPLALKNGIFIDTLFIYNSLAELYMKMGNADSAIYYAKAITDKKDSLSYPKIILTASGTLAAAYKTIHNPDSTLKYLELSNDLKDSIYSNEKQKEFQGLTFNEQLRQQEVQRERQQLKNKIIMYALVSGSLLFLAIALLLYRNNLQKQHAKRKIEKAYDELKATQAQLIQSEKMASLGELTAGIAHEIQNPLNFVNNFSDLNKELLLEMKDGLDHGRLVEARSLATDVIDNEEKINYHGKRADAIVKGMLQHSRSSNGQKELTDINVLADEYLRLAYHGLRAKDKTFDAKLITDFDATIGNIKIIPQDIGRVMLNLITNAFYAVTEKKNKQPESYEPEVSISTKKTIDKVEIKVKDNGNGIPSDVVGKIFQPFFTTKPTGKGTGLGLSLSYDNVKAHGGELLVNTIEGEGSEFIILLPSG